MKIKYIAAVLIAIASLGLQQAKADFIFNLTVPNSGISGFPGPYATVDVHLTDPTHATISFTSLTNGGNIYLFGAVNAVDVNVNATTWTIGSFVATNSGTGFTPGPLSNGGSGTVDGFGVLNQTVNSFDGYTNASNSVTFTLTNTNLLTPWLTANDVIINNSKGFDAAAHIFVAVSPGVASAGALATGFAGEGPQTNVPDGGTTVMLLGAALGALGMARRFIMS